MVLLNGEEYLHVDPQRSLPVPSCSVRYFCCGSMLIFVGSVLLCALGFTVVLPYQATREWPLTTCHVINSSYDKDHCSCDKQPAEWDQCIYKYPCLQIPDRLTDHINMTILNNKGYGSIYRYWNDAFYKSCALYECGDEEWNVREVKHFRTKYGSDNQQYNCYIDPDDPVSLILERTPKSSVIHAILWPVMCLFIGLIIWFGLWCGCWKIDTEDKHTNPGRYGFL